jgi:hypothetical protein
MPHAETTVTQIIQLFDLDLAVRVADRGVVLIGGDDSAARWSKSFSGDLFLGSSGSGGPTASAIPCSDGVAWIPSGQETLGESGTMF